MAYKDPEKRKAYARQYRAAQGGGDAKPRKNPGEARPPVLPLPVRVETAKDVLIHVAEQLAAVRVDKSATTIERARAIALLARVALQAIEAADLTARLEELEALVKGEEGSRRYG